MSPDTDYAPPSTAALGTWHLAAVTIVALAPTLLRNGLPFWELPSRLLLQVPALAIGYLATALLLSLPGRVPDSAIRRLMVAVGVGGVGFGSSLLFLLELPGFDYSRLAVLFGMSVGWILAVLPYQAGPRLVRLGWPGPVLVACGFLGWGLLVSSGLSSNPEVTDTRDRTSGLEATNVHNLRITVHRGLVDPSPSTGGGLVVRGEGFIITNGVGDFRWVSPSGLSLVSERLDLPSPVNRNAFVADNSAQLEAMHFRIMDLIVDTVPNPDRLLVSHYHWDPEERCVALRISGIELEDGGPRPMGGEWENLFTTRPCVPVMSASGEGGLTNHAGGRMAWAPDGRLLLTTGDFLQDGREGSADRYPQLFDNDYGKILAIDRAGRIEPFSIGHRNPEGLLITREGTVWSTEHGPTGGDELNRVRPGGNYGWPMVSYGTEVAGQASPFGSQELGDYEAPTFSWVPSVGVSNLIEVQGDQFPEWEGDLLIASLNGRSLFRTRVLDGRVVLIEPIHLGDRLRDLALDPTGRVVVWTDRSEVIVLENAGDARTGEIVFSGCATCHEAERGTSATAPDLRGVLGRAAGSLEGYDYSNAMRSSAIQWTPETLDAFLENPTAVVPGNEMPFDALDESDRRAVIEFLRGYE